MKGSDFLHKEVLTTPEALRYCKHRGWSISATALYYNGLKFGFMVKAADGFHWEYQRMGLSKFLMQKAVTPPPGYVSVGALARRYNANLSVMYGKIKAWDVDVVRCGPAKKIFINELSYERKRKAKERVYLCK